MRTRLLPILLLAGCLAGCLTGGDRLAGGGGVDVEGISVEGTAMLADHKPAIAALISIRTWDYLKAGGAPKTAIDKADTRTDSSGRFRVDGLDTGRYAVEVDAGKDGATLLEIDADGSQRVLKVEAVIQATGVLSGTVRADGGQFLYGAEITVLGVDRRTRTDSSGAFTFTGLPPGTYIVRITPPIGTLSTLEIPEVTVSAGGTMVLDSVQLTASVPGVFAQWRFDEAKGGVAGEAGGSEARAILKNAASWGAGKQGEALLLKDSGYAFVPKTKSSSLDIQEGADFSLSIWVNADSLTTVADNAGGKRRAVDTRTDYDPNGYSLGLDSTGRAEFIFQIAGDKHENRLAAQAPLAAGTWHFLVVGRSGSRYFLYTDGILSSEATGPLGILTKDNALFFGSRQGKQDFFQGRLDDVRIYPRALTAEEVAALAL